MKDIRFGIGADFHRLTNGRKLIIGGVTIAHPKGLFGHSDADVLTHAVIDALLGSLALGDIGKLFPDNDDRYKDADSLVLLAEVVKIIHGKNFYINNADSVIIAQTPKFAPYIDSIRGNLARVLEVDLERVGVKATTTEKMGFWGEGIGIEARAIASVCCRGCGDSE
ncbi:2-C-methyl-D-erythritol 2,4-cyclodiphosphate synthase [Clostridia bacterium]|nr:2-C-methyl-D-erythritol 2,4-cyclodiphosphate synthase [Clostridia bacterium]